MRILQASDSDAVGELLSRSPEYRDPETGEPRISDAILGLERVVLGYEKDGRLIGFMLVTTIPYFDLLTLDPSLTNHEKARVIESLNAYGEDVVRLMVEVLKFQTGTEVAPPTIVAHVRTSNREWMDYIERRFKRRKSNDWRTCADRTMIIRPLWAEGEPND